MSTTLTMSVNDGTEPINPSYLSESKNWPEFTTTPGEQATRLADENDRELVRIASTQHDLLNRNFLKQTRANVGTAEGLISILCSGTLNFNGAVVRDVIAPRIAAACAAGEPVRIVMPVFCKIGNRAKLMFNQRPSAAEEVSLRSLTHVARQLSQWYSPGVLFSLVTDARLYGSWLRNPAPTITAYNKSLRQLRDEISTNGEVELIEYDELLSEFSREFEQGIHAGMQRVVLNDPELYAALSTNEIYESVRASINTSTLGMTYKDLKECFGPQQNPDNPFLAVLAKQALESTASMLAGRHACRSLEPRLFTRRFGPNYVRATIHRAVATPVLGLRIYPDYKRSSQQLPYHGVPLFYRDGDCRGSDSRNGDSRGRGRVKMLVAPETRFYGDPTLERVTHNDGETYFYQSVK